MAELRQDLIQAAIAGPPPQQGLGGPADIPQAGSIRTGPAPGGVNQDLVQRALNMRPDEVTLKQRAMLGLIKEDPKLQQQFLQRQGFESRVQKGEVQIKGPDGQFVGYNPEGTDVGDFVEYLPEVVEGVVGAVATGAKATAAAAGALAGSVLPGAGTAVGGAAGLAAGAGLGAAVTGATETAKQSLAKGLGLREDLDPGRIAQQAAIGAAVPPIVTKAGQALKAGATGLGKAIFGGVGSRPVDKPAIEQATRIIGGRPTPAQMTNNPIVKTTESLLSKTRLGLGGVALRHQQRVNQVAAIEAAESLLVNRSNKMPEVMGEEFAEKVMASISKKLEPASKLYRELDTSLKNVPADQKTLQEGFERISQEMAESPEAAAVLGRFKPIIDGLDSAEKIKSFRTNIGREIGPTASANAKIAADKLYQLATKARTSSYDNAINELKRIGEPGSEKGLEALKGKLAEADKIWSETTKLAEKALLAPGKQFTGPVKQQAAEVLEAIVPEKRATKFLGNARQAQALEQLSKEGFDEAAGAQLFKIYNKSIRTGQGSRGELSPQKVAKMLDEMSPSVAKQVFKEHGIAKAKALQTLWRSIPEDYNPSGSASALDMLAFATGVSQMTSLSLTAANAIARTPGFQAKAALLPAFTAIADDIKRQGGGSNAAD